MEYVGLKAAELGEPYIFKCGCMIKAALRFFRGKIYRQFIVRSGPAVGNWTNWPWTNYVKSPMAPI